MYLKTGINGEGGKAAKKGMSHTKGGDAGRGTPLSSFPLGCKLQEAMQLSQPGMVAMCKGSQSRCGSPEGSS